MTIYRKVKDRLENDINFRERRFRAEDLVKLALDISNLATKFKGLYPLSESDLSDFAVAHESCRRIYTKVQADHEELRGTDYEDKVTLEQSKVLGMGYEVGYNKDVAR